jgi:hypothetical protein
MKESKVQIRPMLKISVVNAIEEAKNKENKSFGELMEKFLLESESFNKYYLEFLKKMGSLPFEE